MVVRVQNLLWGARLWKNMMGTPAPGLAEGDWQPLLLPALRAGTEGPKSQWCLSDVPSPPKPRPWG